MAAAYQLCETVIKAIIKLKPQQDLLSEIGQVKNDRYGLNSNYIGTEEFNKQLGDTVLELIGTVKWTKVEVLKSNIITSEISNDCVHLHLAGVQTIAKSIRNNYQQHKTTE